ncbi:MAG: DUF4230 domain-containing protein [Chloroflexaceae bacterium]|nr:DUF4230 domain-containing protein [Chloroflexaceae bacterium]
MAIVEKIQGLSDLTTAIFTMETVVPAAQARQIGQITVAETKLLYIARGQVRAGINLSQLTPDAVKVSDRALEIRLPPPQIQDHKIDVAKSRIYDYDRGFLNLGPDVGPQLQVLAQAKTLKTLVDAACTQGILEEANIRAQFAVTQLLSAAGHSTVEVTVTPPASNACRVSPSE